MRQLLGVRRQSEASTALWIGCLGVVTGCRVKSPATSKAVSRGGLSPHPKELTPLRLFGEESECLVRPRRRLALPAVWLELFVQLGWQRAGIAGRDVGFHMR